MHRVDPIMHNMQILCRANGPCIKRQQRAVGRFLQAIALFKPSRETINGCISRSRYRKQIVDWINADSCLRRSR
jgi:hypothetical protein